MKIMRGKCGGTYICFYLGSLETGRVKEVEGISIYEDDFEYVFPVVKKYYPDFCIWDRVNPIKQQTCRNISFDLEKILEWMKTGVYAPEIDYYIKYLSGVKIQPNIEERMEFFKELIKYMWEQEAVLNTYDYLNLEGF